MSLEEEYKELVTKHLDSLISQFEKELSNVANKTFPKGAKFLQVEYDSSVFSKDFSVCMFAIDKEENLVGDVYWFLKNKAVVVPAEIYESEKYEEIEPWETASNILESWLTSRWKNAGNRHYPTYLAHHDSYFMRNIETGADINWDEIVETANA